jgi:hypothetical protein
MMEKPVYNQAIAPKHQTEQQSALPSAANMQPQAPEKAKKPKRSKGEKHFDWVTYVGWNSFANLILGVALTYWSRAKISAKSTFGKSYYNKTGDTTYKSIMENWSREKLGMGDSAGVLVDTTMLSAGGNVTAVGVKFLEDSKPDLVKYYNEKLAPDEVDMPLVDKRKQTWFSVIGGRLVVIAGVVPGMTMLGHVLGKSKMPDPHNPNKMLSKFDAFENIIAKNVEENIFTKRFGWKANPKNPSVLFKVSKVISLDVIAIALGSAIFYVASKALSQKPKPDVVGGPDISGLPLKEGGAEQVKTASDSTSLAADAPLQAKPDAPGAKIQLSQHAHVAPTPASSAEVRQS